MEEESKAQKKEKQKGNFSIVIAIERQSRYLKPS